MLTRPEDLDPDDLRAALASGWGITPTALHYCPVGFGSHHWEAPCADGTRWFVTVDDVSSDLPFAMLRAALLAAAALSAAGLDFVLAAQSMPSADVLWPLGSRYAVSVHPFVDGTAFEWDEWAGPEHRSAVLDMIVALHTASAVDPTGLAVHDMSISGRTGLESALLGDREPKDGPFADEAAGLVAGAATAVRRALDEYDGLVGRHGNRTESWVPTHGEPHPGNTLRTGSRWLLIDWGTARWAPPERDLWLIDPGDGSLLRGYAGRTGTAVRPELIELYRLGWELNDITVEIGRFRRPHTGTADDRAALAILGSGLASLRRQFR